MVLLIGVGIQYKQNVSSRLVCCVLTPDSRASFLSSFKSALMKPLLFSLCFFSCLFVSAQSVPTAQKKLQPPPKVSLGLGIGIDYGGIGSRVIYSPMKQMFLFGALGYNFAGAGYNFGAGLRFAPDRRFSPYVVGMYGYNAVVKYTVTTLYSGYGKSESESSEVFYGPSFGLGFELKRAARKKSKNNWNFEILVPVRSSAYTDHIAMIEEVYGAEMSPSPIAISVGYHIGF